MAQTITITDDLDGKPNAEKVSFSFDGTDYWLDLTPENKKKLEAALSPFIDPAVELKNTKKSNTGDSAKATRPKVSAKVIRAWGNQNGYVTERGPLPQELKDAYNTQFGTSV
ncbi:histone-like nucleoid-structuring protein Lsr2 [Microbacterium sp. Ag1]|uniref:histone-like nucleoid-structuring protein Lsr2 n=1 Tax=Microbacterium sp. Ag1 TaxID=1643443 RepID=UPI000629CD28|nr:Lsr2 family protein [Microbacterium sp. Ag1]KKX96932.1 hypothetical protein AAY78_16715 [Microbacterium sp. Ag1]